MFKKALLLILLINMVFGQHLVNGRVKKKNIHYYNWKNEDVIQVYKVVDPQDPSQDKFLWEYDVQANYPFKNFPDSVPAQWVHEKLIAHNPTRLSKDSVLQYYYRKWLKIVERNEYMRVYKKYEGSDRYTVGSSEKNGFLLLVYRIQFETRYGTLRTKLYHIKILNGNGVFREYTLYEGRLSGLSIDPTGRYLGVETAFPLRFEDYDEEWYFCLDQMFYLLDLETGEKIYSYQDYGYMGGYFKKKMGGFRNVFVVEKSTPIGENKGYAKQWDGKFVIVDPHKRKAYYFPNFMANKYWELYDFDNNVFVLTKKPITKTKFEKKINNVYSKNRSKSSVKEIIDRYYDKYTPSTVIQVFDESDMTVEEF